MAEPTPHKKPTQAELKAEQERIQRELDAASSPSAPAPIPSAPAPSPSPSAPAPIPSAPAPSPSPSAPPPSPSEEDKEKARLKEQYKGSTREAMVQKAGREALAKAIEDAEGLPAPTDDEMAVEYPDWDVMSESEKTSAVKTVINDRRFKMISEANKQSKDLDAWLKQVDEFVDDSAVLARHPQIDGKEDQFRAFAITPSRRGIPLEDLAKIFVFDVTKAPPKKKGEMFPRPSGGGQEPKPPSNKISTVEAINLRENNYDEYKRLLKAGRIDDSGIQ